MSSYRGRHLRPRSNLAVRALRSRFMFGSWLGMGFWAMAILYTELILLQQVQGGFK